MSGKTSSNGIFIGKIEEAQQPGIKTVRSPRTICPVNYPR